MPWRPVPVLGARRPTCTALYVVPVAPPSDRVRTSSIMFAVMPYRSIDPAVGDFREVARIFSFSPLAPHRGSGYIRPTKRKRV